MAWIGNASHRFVCFNILCPKVAWGHGGQEVSLTDRDGLLGLWGLYRTHNHVHLFLIPSPDALKCE